MAKMKILVIDSGIGFCHAKKLADRNEVLYYTLWQDPFPEYKDFILGDGFENITKVTHYEEHLDEVDLIVFTDCGFYKFPQKLRDNGYNVFNGGEAEIIELNRKEFHRLLDDLKLKYPKSYEVVGVDEVYEKLKGLLNGEKYYFLKVNTFRGDIETVAILTKEDLELRINELKYKLGVKANDFDFVIEEEVEGVEIGVDVFFNGEIVRPYLFTFEWQDCTLGRWISESVWDDILEKMSYYLNDTNYRGAFSLEGILTKEKEVYLLDATIRFAYPTSSAIFCQTIKNYDEVLLNCAKSEDVELDLTSEYAIGVIITTEFSYNNWLAFKDNNAKAHYRRVIKKDGTIYLLPGDVGETIACSLVGEGRNLKEVFKDFEEQLGRLWILGMSYPYGVFDKFKQDIDNLKKIGYNIFEI